MDKGIQYRPTCALLQTSKYLSVPEDLSIAPTLIKYVKKCIYHIPVYISKVTVRTVVVPPKVVICEIQPVQIQDKPECIHHSETITTNNGATVLYEIKFEHSDLSKEELERGKALVQEL